MKIVIILLTLITSNEAFGCMSPYGSEELDAKIIVKPQKKENWFSFEVPRYVEGSPNQGEVILAYSEWHAGGIPVYEPYEILETKVNGNKLIGSFKVVKKKEKPYINVYWPPKIGGHCGVMANSNFLEAR